MCRVRFGYAHVVNNKYDQWQMYAIGGSANPTILSEGNFYNAPNDHTKKQVKTNIVLRIIYSLINFIIQSFKILTLVWLFIFVRVTDYQEGIKGKLEELEMEIF